MDGLKLFLKENKIKRENEFFAATESLKDENGETVKWEIRHISTAEDEKIRDECIERNGEKRLNYSLYMKKMAVASVVHPPLYNAQLQDSYSVKTPEELIVKMIDNPGEYQEFIRFIQTINGFDTSMEKRVEKAKN